MKKVFLIIAIASTLLSCASGKKENSNKEQSNQKEFEYIQGGIARGDKNEKKIAIVFTSDGYYDGDEVIRNTLKKHNAKGSFFFTGNAFRLPEFEPIIKSLIADGHYISAHSDKHLLYCAWEKRDSLLVTKDEYIKDIEDNYAEMAKFGITKEDAKYYIPPYEYYNDTISKWTTELGLVLINFTGGTGSNADYTVPSMGEKYRDSETLYNNILNFESEKPNGLNGFLLLIHFGVDPERTDKLYDKMDDLMTELEKRGYIFVDVRELLD
jgi:Predicted xylanase/chitin deacetylase